MDGENNISQLTAEERAQLVRELGEYIVDQAARGAWAPTEVQLRAYSKILAREPEEPEIDVRHAMFSRTYGVEIAYGALLSRVYFPTEESRDEGFRRAIRAAMEYSLWAQLYPDGFRWVEDDGEIGYCIDMDNSISYGWELNLIGEGKPLLIYATEADAQRVADILKREGV